MTPSDISTDSTPEALRQIYNHRFNPMLPYRNAVWKNLVNGFFGKHIPASSRVLDLGCGYGEFINNIKAAQKFGMDLNPGATSHLHPDVRLFMQDCSHTWPLGADSLDIVFTSNFFEHLPDKATLRRTLCEAMRCLAPGGRLIAMGPNIRHLSGAYWDFWDHHLSLSEKSLAEVAQAVGFRVVLSKARFLPYTMVGKLKPPPLLVKLYLKLPFLWPVFGKQFVVVVQKNRVSDS